MSTWRRTLLYSTLIAGGLTLGYTAWSSISVLHAERRFAHRVAWFHPHADFEMEGFTYRVVGWVGADASSLWAIAPSLSAAVVFSPLRLIEQLILGSLVTFVVWCGARWSVRLIACRGPAGLGTSLDLRPAEGRAPGWREVAISPLFAFLSAIGFGLAVTLVYQHQIRIRPPTGTGFPQPSLVWIPTMVFGAFTATAWGIRTLHAVRRRQHAAHRAKESCSNCGYPYGGITADKCPECGTFPPASEHLRAPPRRWRLLLATLTLALAAVLTGFAMTGGIPGLIERALDRNSFLVDSGFHVDVPLRRPILIEGDWGRLYLAGAPVDSGETVIRAVLTDASGNQPAHVATAVIRADTPGVRPPLMAWLAVPTVTTLTADGLLASVLNNAFADTGSRYVQISCLAIEPRRVRALPVTADVPPPIREVLDGNFRDAAAAEQLVPPPPPP